MAPKVQYHIVSVEDLGMAPKPMGFKFFRNITGSSWWSPGGVVENLDELGEEGWIYCGMVFMGETETPGQYAVFYREVPDED